jgi:hypothetical protein
VRTFLSSRGALLHPDHAPHPDTSALGAEVEVYRTERAAGGARWEYILALNTAARPASVRLSHDADDVVAWDVFGRRVVPSMEATLGSGEIAYYVLVPVRAGIAPIGLVDKLVPAPAGLLRSADARGAWRLEIDAPGERFAFWAPQPPHVQTDGGRTLPVQGQSGLWMVDVPESESESVSALVATRR